MSAHAATRTKNREGNGLRGRIPALSGDAAGLLGELFARPRRWLFAQGGASFWLELRIAPRACAGERVELTVNGRPLQLLLQTSRPAPIGELDWSDYADAARLTAWGMAHHATLARLARAFDAIILPQAMAAADAPAPPAMLMALGFRIGEGDDVLDEGVLHAEPVTLRRLLGASEVTTADTRIPPALQALPTSLRICARGPHLRVEQVRALEAGDVLVLGERQQVFSHLHLVASDAGASGWKACWTNGDLRIDAVAVETMDDLRSNPMNETEQNDNPGTDAADAASGDPLAQLPLRIDFTLGEVSIPLAQLSTLAPGYVFALADNIEHARVGIRANGRRIGHGRLVAIGDTLGVQLEGWDADGLQ